MLRGAPALRLDEESMLDGIARGARLSRRGARTGRARGVAPIGRQTAWREREGAAFATGRGWIRGGNDTDRARCHKRRPSLKMPRDSARPIVFLLCAAVSGLSMGWTFLVLAGISAPAS